MTDAEDSAKTPEKQAQAYQRAHELAKRERSTWDQARQEDAATKAWERWRDESRGAPVDQWVRWVLDDKEERHEELNEQNAPAPFEPTPEQDIDAREKLAETVHLGRATATVSLELHDAREIAPADLQPDALRDELGRLADRYRMSVEAGAGGERERAFMDILWALFGGIDPLKWAGQAKYWLDENNLGRGTRKQNVEALRTVLAAEMVLNTPPKEVAARVLQRLRTWPELARETRVPIGIAPWPGKDMDHAAVEEAIEKASGKSVEELAIAVLRALGMPRNKAKDLYK
jgi:hypothetical protein